MRRYETRVTPPQPAIERRVCVGRSCDLCGRVAKDGDEWTRGSYEIGETEVSVAVRCEEGESYPGGGRKVVYEVDICPGCFRGRLIPWLESQGVQVRAEEIDW